jgi:hypothetical protein
MGYRFVLRQLILPLEAKPGQRIPFEMWIDNVGVAPIYRPYRLAFRFRQGEVAAVVPVQADTRKWLPDHTWFSSELVFPAMLQRGAARIDIGIIGDAGEPRVRFAIEGLTADGWHPLTSMDVV